MLYTHKNVQAIAQADIVGGETMEHVVSIDVVTGDVVQNVIPLQIGPDGEPMSRRRKFRAIHPLGRDALGRPCLFHCYDEEVNMIQIQTEAMKVERAKALHQLERLMQTPDYREHLRLMAEHKFHQFTELVRAGFSEDQALKHLKD